MDGRNLIGKYVKDIKSGQIFGKITNIGNRKSKPVAVTNLGKNTFAYIERLGIKWEPVNSPNSKLSNNENNSNENNSTVNQLNINGINPKTITKKKIFRNKNICAYS